MYIYMCVYLFVAVVYNNDILPFSGKGLNDNFHQHLENYRGTS